MRSITSAANRRQKPAYATGATTAAGATPSVTAGASPRNESPQSEQLAASSSTRCPQRVQNMSAPERRQLVELAPGVAAVDRTLRPLDPRRQLVGDTGHDQRRARIEEHDVAGRALGA